MSSTKGIENIIKKRAKSQRLKKSFDALLRPEPKSERKSSPEAKLSQSHNNIKLKKDKHSKVPESQTIKIKIKGAKIKNNNKQQRSVNTGNTNEDLRNSVSQDIKGTIAYKSQIVTKDKMIEEQQRQIEDLKAELHHLRNELDRVREKEKQQQQQISEIKSEKGMREIRSQKDQEIEGMTSYIEQLKSQLLAQKLQNQEYLSITKRLMMVQDKGMSKAATVIKDILLKKVKTALGRIFVHVGEITVTNKHDNPREVERLLYELPGRIEEEIRKELSS